MRRVDEIVGRLAEGVHYMVPTVVGALNGQGPMEIHPVVGTRHYDVEYFNVHMPHYHLDLRFVGMEWWRERGSAILVGVGERADGTFPELIHRRMRCLQAHVIISVRSHPSMPGGCERMHEDFRGVQCGGSAREGWICPHKGTFLGGQPPYEGVVTCPAHGLRIDWRTGRVL